MSDLDTKIEESIHIEEVVSKGDDDVYRPEVVTRSVNERRLFRKVDVRLVPLLALFYLANTLDRGAIGNARVCFKAVIVF